MPSKQPYAEPPPGAPLHPDGKPYYGYNAKGNPICAYPETNDGKPCAQAPISGRRRCRLHGGKNLRGEQHPNFKHGRYIKRNQSLPALGQLIEEKLTDENWLSMQSEIAALRARFEQQVQRLASLQPSIAARLGKQAYKLLNEGYGLIEDAINNPKEADSPQRLRDGKGKVIEGIHALREALKRTNVETEAWSELRETGNVIKGMLGTELQREKIERNYISGVDFLRLMGIVRAAIIEHVPDAKARAAIAQTMNDVLNERKLLSGGE